MKAVNFTIGFLMSFQNFIDSIQISGTKMVIVSSVAAAGVMAFYGYPTNECGNWLFRCDLTFWQNVGIYFNAVMLVIGLLKKD